MPSYRVTNRSSAPVLLRLRSGPTLHLAPGEHSASLHSAEVMRNPRIESLRERRLVDVDEVDEVDDAAESAGGQRSPRRRRSGKAAPAAAPQKTDDSDEAAESTS